MSDEEEEDGQFTKDDEEEERDRRLFAKPAQEEDLPISMEDLNKVRLTRDVIAKHCMSPWFEEYIKGVYYLSPILLHSNEYARRCLGTVLDPG